MAKQLDGSSHGDFVLDGDQAPLPKRGGTIPNFRPISIVAKRLHGSRCTWYGGRPRLRRHCVRWGRSSPPQKGTEPPPQFSAHEYCGQTAVWIKMALVMEVCLGPGHIVLDRDPAALTKKGGRAPNFRRIFIVAKRLDASRCHLVWSMVIL